jgi:hypothetical protein
MLRDALGMRDLVPVVIHHRRGERAIPQSLRIWLG